MAELTKTAIETGDGGSGPVRAATRSPPKHAPESVREITCPFGYEGFGPTFLTVFLARA